MSPYCDDSEVSQLHVTHYVDCLLPNYFNGHCYSKLIFLSLESHLSYLFDVKFSLSHESSRDALDASGQDSVHVPHESYSDDHDDSKARNGKCFNHDSGVNQMSPKNESVLMMSFCDNV